MPTDLPRTQVAIVGGVGTAKTSLCLALSESANLPDGSDRAQIRVVPGDDLSRLKTRSTESFMRSRAPSRATEKHQTFEVSVDYHREPRHLFDTHLERSLRIGIHDAPGGHFYVPEAVTEERQHELRRDQDRLIDALVGTDVLVITIDSTRPKDPDVARELQGFVHRLANRSAQQHQEAQTTWWQRWFSMRLFGLQPAAARKRTAIRAKHVLVLLTKADLLAADLMAVLEDGRQLEDYDRDLWEARRDRSQARMTPWGLVHELDPLSQAFHIVGPGTLHALWSVLPPGGRLAVGLCSAGGFCARSGQPTLDRSGVPNKLGAEEAAPLYEAGRPFGVREAIGFIACGETGGPVAEVFLEDIEAAVRSPVPAIVSTRLAARPA